MKMITFVLFFVLYSFTFTVFGALQNGGVKVPSFYARNPYWIEQGSANYSAGSDDSYGRNGTKNLSVEGINSTLSKVLENIKAKNEGLIKKPQEIGNKKNGKIVYKTASMEAADSDFEDILKGMMGKKSRKMGSHIKKTENLVKKAPRPDNKNSKLKPVESNQNSLMQISSTIDEVSSRTEEPDTVKEKIILNAAKSDQNTAPIVENPDQVDQDAIGVKKVDKVLQRNNSFVPKPPRMPSKSGTASKSPKTPSRFAYTPRQYERQASGRFGAELLDTRSMLVESGRLGSKRIGTEHEAHKPLKVINSQRNGLFLDLEDIPDVESLGDKMDACGKYALKDMKLMKLKSKSGRVNEYYVYPHPFSGGISSKVYHGSPRDARDMDGTPIRDCVAIKSVLLDLHQDPGVLEGFKKEEEFLMRFRNGSSGVKHIVHLYEKNEEDPSRLIFILELGKHDLMKWLQLMREQWKDQDPDTIDPRNVEGQLEKVLRQVLEAVVEMHSKTIHLDLKPDNLLLIEKRNAEGQIIDEILKIIDFGASEEIDPKTDKSLEVSKVANVCRMRDVIYSDDRYSAPEQAISCLANVENMPVYPVSTKSDIWSIGIMLAEFSLLSPFFGEIDSKVIRKSSNPENIYNAVLSINHLHYPVLVMTQSTRPYLKYLKKIHDYFPRFYKIIKICLNVDPNLRPTAKGILDFLDGKCKFYEPNNNQSLEQPQSKFDDYNSDEFCDIGLQQKELGSRQIE